MVLMMASPARMINLIKLIIQTVEIIDTLQYSVIIGKNILHSFVY